MPLAGPAGMGRAYPGAGERSRPLDAESRRWAAHLLRRAGFGGTPDEIDAYAALGYEGAVERLLNPASVDDGAAEEALPMPAGRRAGPRARADGWAVPRAGAHDAHPAPPAREDDPLLA